MEYIDFVKGWTKCQGYGGRGYDMLQIGLRIMAAQFYYTIVHNARTSLIII